MLTHPIPFEVHITTTDLATSQIDLFVKMCAQIDGKPLLIELSQGEYTKQPMLSKVIYANHLEDILAQASNYCRLFKVNGFQTKRVKIEVPSSCVDKVQGYKSEAFEPYFEWHGKTQLDRTTELLEVCTSHKVHLSLNSLKGESTTRFITLREFGRQETFLLRVNALLTALEQGGWPILKQQSEYCLYDTNTLLDQGWLPQ